MIILQTFALNFLRIFRIDLVFQFLMTAGIPWHVATTLQSLLLLSHFLLFYSLISLFLFLQGKFLLIQKFVTIFKVHLDNPG